MLRLYRIGQADASSAAVGSFLKFGSFALAALACSALAGNSALASRDVFATSAASDEAAVTQDASGYVPEKDADGNYTMPDLSDIENMPTVDPEDLPVSDNLPDGSQVDLPELNLSDEELAGMGVDPTVVDALKGSGMSERDEWACTCLLCLANPNGWRSVSACHSPVKRLFDHLKRHSMPKCPQAGAGNDMVLVSNPTDPCKKMGLEDVSGWVYVPGRGPVHSSAYQNEGTDYCVSGYRQSLRMCVRRDSEGYCAEYATVRYYETIERNIHESPYSIDVIIDGEVFNRTHGWR